MEILLLWGNIYKNAHYLLLEIVVSLMHYVAENILEGHFEPFCVPSETLRFYVDSSS